MSHTGILPRAAVVLPSLSEFSPSYKNLVPDYWRDVIVAGRSRKSSAPFDAGLCLASRTGRRPIGTGLERDGMRLNRPSRSSFLFEHDLFGKPVSTFPDHALAPRSLS